MSTIDSYNWSGARVTSDVLPVLFPQATASDLFTSVKATWRVSNVRLRGAQKELRSATWIGLDGGTWNLSNSKYTVLQAGVYHHIEPGQQPIYTAFCGVDTGDYDLVLTDLYASPSFFVFPVKPSDKIKVELSYKQGSTTATADFTGTISAGLPANPVILIPITPGQITGYTVEWIFERISKYNKSRKDFGSSYHALGNHEAVVFKDAEAKTNQGNLVSPDDGDSINMRDVDDWPTLVTGGVALSNQVEIKQRKDSA
jgi:Peptidase A4 family